MQFTIDAHQLYQTLKRVNIQRRMYPYMQLWAEAGQVSLLTITEPSRDPRDVRMVVHISLSPSILAEEGSCIVYYKELLHAAKTLPGMLQLQAQERAILVSSEGPQIHQMSVEMQPVENFPAPLFVQREEGEYYTTERSMGVVCDTCNSYHYRRVVDTYQVTAVQIQSVRVNHDLLASMCKQVLWASEPENYHRQAFTGIQVALIDSVLSFIVADGHCVVKRSQRLSNAGSWLSSVLIPAARLALALKLLPHTEVLMESVITEHQLVSTDKEPSQGTSSIVRPELVRLSAGNISVTISLIDVPLPDYLAAVPSSFEACVLCATDDLLSAVKAVMPVNRNESHAARFELSSTKGIRIQSERDQSASSALQEVSTLQNAEQDVSILLSSWYMHAFLKMVPTSEVRLAVSGKETPVVLRSTGGQEEYLLHLMPMALRVS